MINYQKRTLYIADESGFIKRVPVQITSTQSKSLNIPPLSLQSNDNNNVNNIKCQPKRDFTEFAESSTSIRFLSWLDEFFFVSLDEAGSLCCWDERIPHKCVWELKLSFKDRKVVGLDIIPYIIHIPAISEISKDNCSTLLIGLSTGEICIFHCSSSLITPIITHSYYENTLSDKDFLNNWMIRNNDSSSFLEVFKIFNSDSKIVITAGGKKHNISLWEFKKIKEKRKINNDNKIINNFINTTGITCLYRAKHQKSHNSLHLPYTAHITTLDFIKPYLIVAGCYNGEILFYDFTIRSTPIAIYTANMSPINTITHLSIKNKNTNTNKNINSNFIFFGDSNGTIQELDISSLFKDIQVKKKDKDFVNIKQCNRYIQSVGNITGLACIDYIDADNDCVLLVSISSDRYVRYYNLSNSNIYNNKKPCFSGYLVQKLTCLIFK